MIPALDRYLGTLFGIKYLFIHYSMLTGPEASIALITGLAASVLGMLMLFLKPTKKDVNLFILFSLVPIIIGCMGTIHVINIEKKAEIMEARNSMFPSAERYYDINFLYTELTLRLFPLVVSCIASIPLPFLITAVQIKSKFLSRDNQEVKS